MAADHAVMQPASAVTRPTGPSRLQALLRALFGTPLNAVLSLLLLWLAARLAIYLVDWAIVEAAFFPAVPATCREATGACWSFVIAKHSQILFGIYPLDERWRPAVVCVLLVGLLAWSMRPASWHRNLGLVWLATLAATFLLMAGGVFGLTPVPTSAWGGLPVTLILTVVAIGAAFPLAILLALARRSDLPVIRMLSVAFIETTRALPLLSILFIASIMLPLLVPEALLPDKFFRALLALWLFASAYMAEVIRGGLQAIPRGQHEAALSLGLGYWQAQRLVILPQAITLVIPALTNTVIVMIKNTSLVLVVGLFDLVSSGKAALADPEWNSPSAETYVFIALIYFALCFSFSQFAHRIEQRSRPAP